MSVRVEPLTGHGIAARLGDVARLRIEVFRAYPYLYDGDLEYEHRYLAAFAASRDGVVVAACDGDEVVGAATAAPLSGQAAAITAPFRTRSLDLTRYFYFGESVLRSDLRGQGIGVRFFELREAHARAHGAEHAAFCAVVRADNHPDRPKDYVPLDRFWRRRGYTPTPGLICGLSWKEIGEAEETEKPMQFWTKRLAP